MLLLMLYAVIAYADKPVVSIIIDDMGYRLEHDRMALMLSGPLTYAVLPHSPGARQVIRTARRKGSELMLHLPMESAGIMHTPSPGMLTRSMDWITFVRTIQKNLAAVPGIVAVNNHEGSLLTTDYLRMRWLAEELSRHRGIAFIDSRTTHHTVALKAAREVGLPATRRDIFLDYEQGRIKQQFDVLISMAKQQGSVLAIAHPYEETIGFLKDNLRRLQQQGIELVPVSQLIAKRLSTLKPAGGNHGKSISSTGGRL